MRSLRVSRHYGQESWRAGPECLPKITALTKGTLWLVYADPPLTAIVTKYVTTSYPPLRGRLGQLLKVNERMS